MSTKWLERLEHYESIGFKEVPGPGSNDHILKWAHGAGQATWVKDDATPWCGIGLAGIFDECGLQSVIPKDPAAAISWAKCGIECEPRVGAILVFNRTGGHHVTVIKSIDGATAYCIGCNQGDAIKTSPFHLSERIACRWPLQTLTEGEMVSKSRIVSAADQQQSDLKKAGYTGSPQLAPDVPAPQGWREAVGGWTDQLGWFKGVADGGVDFAAYALSNWRVVLLAVTVFFIVRAFYGSNLISKFRTEDHNAGYTA